MKDFSKFRRRIRPELSAEIMRLYLRDFFGFEGEPQEISREECRAYVESQPDLKDREFNLEKDMWALNESICLWEDSAIKLGKYLSAIKAHETQEQYLNALERIAGGKISGELADAYIQAYEEDANNG
jgi:hypothetical protein